MMIDSYAEFDPSRAAKWRRKLFGFVKANKAIEISDEFLSSKLFDQAKHYCEIGKHIECYDLINSHPKLFSLQQRAYFAEKFFLTTSLLGRVYNSPSPLRAATCSRHLGDGQIKNETN